MTAHRAGAVAIAALLAGTASSGCAAMSRSARYAEERVTDNIRQDYQHGLYFAGAAHVIMAPLTFLIVLVGDPASRNPPEPARAPAATDTGH